MVDEQARGWLGAGHSERGWSCVWVCASFHLLPALKWLQRLAVTSCCCSAGAGGASWQQVTASEGPAGSRGWEAAGGEMQSPSSARLSLSIWSSHSLLCVPGLIRREQRMQRLLQAPE